MNTPAGLKRFTRSMPTRYNGHCTFCAKPTATGVDFAALTAGQKWLTVCVTCSTSITEQVIAVLTQLGDAQEGVAEDALTAVAQGMPAGDALALAVSGEAAENVAYDVLVKLQGVLAALRSIAPVAAPDADPRGLLLQAIANNPNAAPRDRDFAGSLADWVLVKGRDLSPKQAPHADRLIAEYATGVAAPVAEAAGIGLYQHNDGTVRKVYETQNGRLAAKVLVVLNGHGSFQYEQGGRRVVTEAVAAGTAHVMTQDEAAAFGRLHSFCCNCCRDLDDDRSLAAGYGPTCASNQGWFYPSYEQASEILGRPCGKAKPTDES